MGLCNDKELVINGKAIRSPEQQVWQNMRDIEMLKSFIKPIYQTTAELTSESTGVLISDTNVPEGTKVGWILTEDGLFFQIEDSNETSLLLLFLADLKGPQGEAGLSIHFWNGDLQTTIGNYTQISVNYYKVGEVVVGKNGYIGTVISTSSSFAMVKTTASIIGPQGEPGTNVIANPTLAGTESDLIGIQIGDTKYKIGGGKQLYLHILNVVGYYSGNEIRGYFQIIDDSNLPYAKNSEYVEGENQNIATYFQNKGFTAQFFNKCYPAIIYAYDNTLYNGIGSFNNYLYVFANYAQTAIQLTGTTLNDTIIAL